MNHVEEILLEGKELGKRYFFTEMYIDGYESSEIIVNPYDNYEKKMAFLKANYGEDLRNFRAPVTILSYGYCDDLSELEYVYHGEAE
jgi:hypothetical protein